MKSPSWYNRLKPGKKLAVLFFISWIVWFCFEYAWSFIPGDEERYTIQKMLSRSGSMTIVVLFLSKPDLIKEVLKKNKSSEDDAK